MPETVENHLLEHLKRFQASQDRIEHKLDDVVARVGELDVGIAALRRHCAHADENAAALSVRLGRVSERLNGIERRLELSV